LTTYTIGGVELARHEYVYVIEYLKDQNQRRAAKMAGRYSPEDIERFINNEKVQHAIAHSLGERMKVVQVDAQWLVRELVENHYLARYDGKINASNQALMTIGKLATVDAFAAEKVQVTNATDVVAKLQRGRDRNKKVAPAVSFIEPKS
jgi:hypothetical protein